ncbi:MAG: redox-regulated ATPase YchF [Bryobacteraceae bacterium]
MRTAIIGLPQTGKTSLFTILTGAHQATRLGTLAARVGVAKVPDPRLDAVAAIFRPGKVTHATIEYVDTPPISKEALRDPGYLAGLRIVDAFAHVLRVFQDDRVPHELGSLDPVRDLEHVETELILSDLAVAEKRLERLDKDRKKVKSQELDQEAELLERVKAQLESGCPLRELPLGEEEEKRLRGFQFLSQKPMLWVLNLGEAEAPRLHEIEAEFRARAGQRPRTAITAVCGKIEAELSELSPEEAQQYRESFGLPDSGLQRLVEATFSLLGLISFFTGSQPEVRAWTVPRNTTALKAAGAIHSDFEERFIRAEVISWKDLVAAGSLAAARERGLLRLEGRDYVVQDGDVLQIRHG